MKNLLTVLAVAVLSGCGGPLVPVLGSVPRAEGESQEYVTGYIDGCRSWRLQARGVRNEVIRDVGRYREDAQYREGWEEGYDHCRSEKQKWNPALRSRE